MTILSRAPAPRPVATPCPAMVGPDSADRIPSPGACHADTESLVKVFDVGVLATFTEGISNSVMEYMACGKPVVATAGGGTTELVIEGQTGYLVPPSDPARLAAAIERLLSDPALRQRLGAAGRERVATAFSLGRMVERHRETYRP